MSCENHRFDENNKDLLLEREREIKWDPPRFLAQFGLRPGETVLDLGCGPGFWTISLAESVGLTGTVWALDISDKLLDALTRRKPPLQVKTMLSELPVIPLPDASVDFVWAAFIFHEIRGAGSLADEIHRVMKPGGTVAVLDWRPDAEENGGPPLHHRITTAQVLSYLKKAGFSTASQIWQDSDNYLIRAY
ncbi:MAG: class I SAM-dependent methyltransferase [Candidatus Xenobiia bacterium LiM19]